MNDLTHPPDSNTLDSLLEGFQLIGFDWKYLYVNTAVVKQARYKKEELLGHTMMELYPGIEQTEMFRKLTRCMNERVPDRMENEFTFPDGTKGWFELRMEPVTQGVFILSMDISERKKAEDALRELNKSLEDMVAQRTAELAEKNKEITQSIIYAKRIQQALLPPVQSVRDRFPESFILYKPKDIIAGDFYWMHTENHEDNEHVIFAVADCTGHGVPGALMSVICHNAMDRAVLEFGLKNPGSILDKTRQLVVQQLGKNDVGMQDGMDIAVIAMEGDTLHFAGANNPLWIIRDGKLMEIRADRQPVGKAESTVPFTTQTVKIRPGDCFYMSTDGFADQFGGLRGKKFKYSTFKEQLLAHHRAPMNEQLTILDKMIEDWRGDLEQVDDILVVGLCVR